jgi:hypothetical protein
MHAVMASRERVAIIVVLVVVLVVIAQVVVVRVGVAKVVQAGIMQVAQEAQEMVRVAQEVRAPPC